MWVSTRHTLCTGTSPSNPQIRFVIWKPSLLVTPDVYILTSLPNTNYYINCAMSDSQSPPPPGTRFNVHEDCTAHTLSSHQYGYSMTVGSLQVIGTSHCDKLTCCQQRIEVMRKKLVVTSKIPLLWRCRLIYL